MTYTKSIEKLHNSEKGGAWARAISDTEREIQSARSRILRLKESPRIFKKHLANGDPWPIEAPPRKQMSQRTISALPLRSVRSF